MTKSVAFSFRKEEKLCSQKMMGELFLSGNSFLCYPIKVVWKAFDQLPADVPVQVAFSVPKRQFKRAVDRNRLKRVIRECYRLQKSALYEIVNQADVKIAISLIYIAKEEIPFDRIYPAVTKVISKMNGQLGKANLPGS